MQMTTSLDHKMNTSPDKADEHASGGKMNVSPDSARWTCICTKMQIKMSQDNADERVSRQRRWQSLRTMQWNMSQNMSPDNVGDNANEHGQCKVNVHPTNVEGHASGLCRWPVSGRCRWPRLRTMHWTMSHNMSSDNVGEHVLGPCKWTWTMKAEHAPNKRRWKCLRTMQMNMSQDNEDEHISGQCIVTRLRTCLQTMQITMFPDNALEHVSEHVSRQCKWTCLPEMQMTMSLDNALEHVSGQCRWTEHI